MASGISNFSITIPAGTSIGSGWNVALSVALRPLEAIRWRVPPGPRGVMGWALYQSGVQMLPDSAGTFVIADDEWDTWDVRGVPESGAWSVRGYNSGANNHAVYLQFWYDGSSGSGSGSPPPDTGDITAGFPASDSQIAGMWL